MSLRQRTDGNVDLKIMEKLKIADTCTFLDNKSIMGKKESFNPRYL